jgi:hypothetical protein
MGQASSNVDGTIYQYNLNGTFSNLGGSLEVIYAVSEPSSGWLAIVGGLGLAGLSIVRRRAAKRA